MECHALQDQGGHILSALFLAVKKNPSTDTTSMGGDKLNVNTLTLH